MDSDTELKTEDRFWELVKVMESDESIGLAQAKVVLAKDKRRLDYVCTAIDALGTWAATYGLKEDKLKENFEVLAASSSFCIVGRGVSTKLEALTQTTSFTMMILTFPCE